MRSPPSEPPARPAVALVGPDPDGRGGMAAVSRGLLDSELGRRYAIEPIVTHRAGARCKGAFVFAGGLLRLLGFSRRHRSGIVHVHSAVRGSLYRKALVVGLARALRHPTILHVHAGPGDIEQFAARRRPLELRAFRAAFAAATRVVTVSQASADSLAQAFGRADFAVIPNAAPVVQDGVPVGAAASPAALYLGGFEDPAKGGAVLARALPQALAAQVGLRVELAGPGDPPPELTALLGERVSWRGWLAGDEKRAAFDAAEIAVLPSVSEGLPVVLLEAMAHGRAIVATRVGGIPDVASDGCEALLVEPGDADALAQALARLAGDAALRRRLGAAARERVSGFDERELVERLDALYREVLAC